MTTAESVLNNAVERELARLRSVFPDPAVRFAPDGAGGAYVVVCERPLSVNWVQNETWVGFHVVHNTPYADTYPHYVRSDLARVDGAALGSPFSGPTTWDGLTKLSEIVGETAAVQISRRSNHRDGEGIEGPLEKLLKVLQWLNSR